MDSELAALASAHGVATSYEDGERRTVDVSPEVVAAVLERLGVPASSTADVRAGLAATERERDALPATILLREGQTRPLPAPGTVRTEDGRELAVSGALPSDLPLGWHELDCAGRAVTLVVAPAALPEPPACWGWALQLYALHSAESWGMGDFGDLRGFAGWSGSELGADLVLVNPLHAVTPVHPIEPSPYSPSSRAFYNPLYLRLAELAEYASAPDALRSRVNAHHPASSGDRVDYDAVWRAKRAALDLLAPSRPAQAPAGPLRDFATFCALAERHGPRWRDWPAELQHPESLALSQARGELAERVGFHIWLQRRCEEQLGRAADAGSAAGMRIGLVSDLAVGIDPGGADAWAQQDVLSPGVRIGAPPDAFNQRGQDWALQPWHPHRLAEKGYAPFRDMLRAQLAHAGGIRVDHVAGLWRLWWIPEGNSPEAGTYVHYDAETMLGVLALEAHRAGAVVIGEDLGTVEPVVTRTLEANNMLGTAVSWFQRDGDEPGEPPLPPRRWPARSMASLSTHDLPTAPGFLAGEHVRVRAGLGLLDGPDAERTRAEREQAQLVALLVRLGFVGDEPGEWELLVGMHRMLAATPCRILLASPYDVAGERRQPNLPGTVEAYPNWRLPLPERFEALRSDPRVEPLVGPLRAARPRPRTG
jgi:4-alpha-glucanotransferase